MIEVFSYTLNKLAKFLHFNKLFFYFVTAMYSLLKTTELKKKKEKKK